MIYQEFKQHILCMLQSKLDPDATITIQDIIKNNGIHLDGLTVLSTGSNISPTVYLNYYFHQYEGGIPLSVVCDEILKIYRDFRPHIKIDPSFFTDYDKVRSRIVFKLINYERNKELLSKVPHYRFLDLTVVFCCLLQSDISGHSTILIHNQHLDFWHVTRDDLYALAAENTPRLLQHDLRNMDDILQELFSDYSKDLQELEAGSGGCFRMYVLTNKSRLNGSVCILYQGLLEKIAELLNSDLYILPSSIHEVLLIPAERHISCSELTEMVQEVNGTQLAPEEILSDHVYYFSQKTGQITM